MADAPPSLITVHTDLGPRQLTAGSSVQDLLIVLADKHPACLNAATAVNGQFVPRAARACHVLRDGDTLLCFSAITGG